MSIFVKICGIRDAATAAAAVDAGADAIGFVFAKSVRRVTAAEAREAAAAVPAGVRRVAVMKQPSQEEWREVLEEFEPDVLQTDVSDFAGLNVPEHVETWPVFREGADDTSADMPGVFVYEGQASGAGETVDWNAAGQVGQKGRMILAGGLSAENVAEAIRTSQPWGVDVSSGVESQPGKKDVNRIGEFISAVRAAEKEV